MGLPRNSQFIMEIHWKSKLRKVDDLGVPLFQETAIYNVQMHGYEYSVATIPGRLMTFVLAVPPIFWVETINNMCTCKFISPKMCCHNLHYSMNCVICGNANMERSPTMAMNRKYQDHLEYQYHQQIVGIAGSFIHRLAHANAKCKSFVQCCIALDTSGSSLLLIVETNHRNM